MKRYNIQIESVNADETDTHKKLTYDLINVIAKR